MASNRRWCSSLRNRCQSNSTSTCGAVLEPFPAASFLDLLAGSFFRAISYEDTFVNLVYKKYQSSQQRPNKLKGCIFISTKRKCRHAIRKQSHWGMCYFMIYVYIHAYTHIFVKNNFMIHIHMYIHTFF